MRAEDLHLVQAEFDIITCLWNVLGHIFPFARRIEVLRKFARLLSPQGKLFIDVSHRYTLAIMERCQPPCASFATACSGVETNGGTCLNTPWKIGRRIRAGL